MERIEGLQIELGLDDAALKGGLTGLKGRLKTVNQEMRANLSAFDRADQSIEKYQTTLTGLNRKLEVQTAVTEKARKEYAAMVKEYGEGSEEAHKAAREYNQQVSQLNNLNRSIERTSEKLESLQRDQKESTSSWAKFRRSVDQAGDSLTDLGDRMSQTGGAMTATLTAPIAGLGFAAGKTAIEFDKAQGRIQAQLGITSERASELSDIAEKVWKKGFGEGVGEVADSIGIIAQRMGDLTDGELQDMTEAAFTLSEAFGVDVNESTRAAAQLMKNFGVTGADAMDMITAGFQRGANFSDDFLDTITEYSTQFKNLGYSAEEMMGMFVRGGEKGLFSLDKLADAVKESFLQITDGADGTNEALQELGIDANQLTRDIQSGGDKANAAFGVVMTALAGVEDGYDRNRLAIELMGVPLEDLGPQFVDFFSETDSAMKDFRGSTKKAADALQDNLGDRARKVWRQFQDDLEPVGEVMIEFAEDILPKVADVVGDVADAFDDLSPGAKKTAVAIGGVAAAAGPTLTALGFMSTGLGGVMKILSPLLGVMGGGKGFLGILRKIPGPVGLVATGLGLATGGFNLYKNAVEESKTVNLEHAETLADQSSKMSDLTGKYNDLRDKNKLTNDELLRFRDINSELNLATSADEIARLKDEQAKLQEKSGLSNDELSTMFNLNDDLISQAPTIDQTFSDRGNAIINTRDGLKEANNELREQLRLELETQRIKADANLDQAIRDQITALGELGAKEAELDAARAERDAQRLIVKQNEKALEEAIRSGNQASITIAENELMLSQGVLTGLNTEVGKRADVLQEKQKAVAESQNEINKTQELYNKLIDIQLAQAGINGKGKEGIAQLDESIKKTKTRLSELDKTRDEQGGLNGDLQKEYNTLTSNLGVQQNSRAEIKRIQGEQSTVNQRVDEGKRKAEGMTKELGRDTKKKVDVSDGGAIDRLNRNASKSISKTVTISALISGLTKKAKNLLGFQKGTRFAPGGMAVVGEAGPELMFVPRGSKVIPNDDSKKIFKNWNVPGFATGGIATRPGIYKLAEEGFPEVIIPTNPTRRSEASKLLAIAGKAIDQPRADATTSRATSSGFQEPPRAKQPIMIQLITPDRREFARWLIDDLAELQKLQSSRLSLFERS
jgi:TP901 family phage tail tape measure protein